MSKKVWTYLHGQREDTKGGAGNQGFCVGNLRERKGRVQQPDHGQRTCRLGCGLEGGGGERGEHRDQSRRLRGKDEHRSTG